MTIPLIGSSVWLQEENGEYFCVFRRQKGRITDRNSSALGQSRDGNEKDMGISEVKNTVNRIRYIRDQEETIRQRLSRMFRQG